jgi:chemotaxis signal transduction protein
MTAYLRVAIGEESYGIAVSQVREVAELGELVAVPGSSANIAGVCRLHGELLPVIRLGGMLKAGLGEPRRIVVVEDGTRLAGLAVDQAERLEDLPEPEAAGEPLTRGAVLHEGHMIGLVDVAALLDAVTASVR